LQAMRLQEPEGQSLRKSHGGLKYRIITVDCAWDPLARTYIKEPS